MVIIPKFLYPNFEKGRGGKHPELIVEHIIGLPGVTAESAYQHFSNPASEVSAHYIIKRTGEIWQCVRDEDTSWANGSISYRNGVPLLPTNSIAKRAYQTGVRINQIALSIENEGSEYDELTSAQTQANVFLIKELSRKFNIPIDSTHICGHREIKLGKVCPGKISVGKIIAMCNEPIKVTSDIIPATAYTTAKIEIPPFQKPQWLLNLEYRVKATLGFSDPMFGGVPRASDWMQWRKQHIHTTCDFCGTKRTLLKPLQLHHCYPYHLDPSKEKDRNNVVTLCQPCHIRVGHLMNFQSYNPDIKSDIEVWTKKIENRP